MWEEVDHRQTGGHGDAKEVIGRARMKVDDMRADVALVIADAYLARQQPAAAISVLEPASEASPEREDILQRLELAYVKTDQRRKAEGIRTGNLQPGVK
jgi:predicted Zn-dependent protease